MVLQLQVTSSVVGHKTKTIDAFVRHAPWAISFSQVKTSEDYFKKSNAQKSGARVLLIVGGALLAGAIIIAAPGNTSFDNLGILATVGAVGGLAVIGSIPLFIASERNKRKAGNASVYLNMEKRLLIQQQNLRLTRYPALRINL